MLKRRLPYSNIMIQCDADTTPEHLQKHGMVCAILTWMPERTDDGAIVEEGFSDDDATEGEERVVVKREQYKEPPLSSQPANDPPDGGKEDD